MLWRTVAATNTGVSDSDDELHSEPGSTAGDSDQGEFSDRDPHKHEGLDQELLRKPVTEKPCQKCCLGHRTQPHLSAVSAGWPDTACFLPCPPGPSIKTP